tara:strand:+ start:432 stop:611 length:180 start_codon:yes stop_codon:yes gene_type:complete
MVAFLVLLTGCAQKNHYPPAREKQAEYLEEQKEEYDNPTERYVEDNDFLDTRNQPINKP